MDDWPLAKILLQISGGKPRSVTVEPVRRDRPRGVLLSRGPCHSLVVVLPGTERVVCGGRSLGELSGGNWMADCDGRSFTGAASVAGRARSSEPSQPRCTTNLCPLSGGCRRGPAGASPPPLARRAR